jgi:hypothetical protein
MVISKKSGTFWVIAVSAVALVGLAVSCNEHSKVDEMQALARDAYATADSANSKANDLDARVTDLEHKLDR